MQSGWIWLVTQPSAPAGTNPPYSDSYLAALFPHKHHYLPSAITTKGTVNTSQTVSQGIRVPRDGPRKTMRSHWKLRTETALCPIPRGKAFGKSSSKEPFTRPAVSTFGIHFWGTLKTNSFSFKVMALGDGAARVAFRLHRDPQHSKGEALSNSARQSRMDTTSSSSAISPVPSCPSGACPLGMTILIFVISALQNVPYWRSSLMHFPPEKTAWLQPKDIYIHTHMHVCIHT